MNLDSFVTITSVVASFAALYLSLKKYKHEAAKTDSETQKNDSEADNIDADTIVTLRKAINDQEKERKEYRAEQEKLYKDLQKDFENYKISMNKQLEFVVSENVKLRRWARKLIAQLEAAGILPTPFEL